MTNFPFFGDCQPLEGRISFICREAFKDNARFEYRRIYCLEDDGMFTIIIDKNTQALYSVEVKKKKKFPKEEPIKDSTKKEIIKII